jgi:3-oxoacyl-[acyl-carrier protein] reductase
MAEYVVVTGGSRGLGLGLVERLLAEGYVVASIARRTSGPLLDLKARYGDALHLLDADLGEIEALPDLIGRINEVGSVYGLINNAAVATEGLLVTSDPWAIERMVSVNLVAPMLLTRLILKRMIRARRGRVINVTSVSARRAYRGLAAYGATKAGMEAFTRALASEVGRRHITVNAVAPGFLETDMSASLTEAQRARILARTPSGEFVRPADVAGLVVYLLSPAAQAITGATYAVDGGASL